MSEQPLPESAPATPQVQEAPASQCPITSEFLPPNMRKHVDVKAPVPLRMMAAKGLVPMSPADQIGALFMLTFDPEQAVRETAAKTALGLPDRILGTAFRDEGVAAPVLGYFLAQLRDKEVYAEMLVLNASTPDEAVAQVAGSCSPKVAEIISQNQLRVLRHDEIIRQLCKNPAASAALIDGVCDFAVRSGMELTDVPQMNEARVRLFGPQAVAAPPPQGPTAEEILNEFQELKDESTAPIEEGKKLNLTQRVMKMSISQKIKLATLGNKEARTLLMRDSNKLVAVAVIRSPRITIGEIRLTAMNRAAQDDVLRVVYSNKDWVKDYNIKLALVKNPKVPLAITMRWLSTLHESDVKDLSRDRNVPNNVRAMAKKMVDKKAAPAKSEGGH